MPLHSGCLRGVKNKEIAAKALKAAELALADSNVQFVRYPADLAGGDAKGFGNGNCAGTGNSVFRSCGKKTFCE